MLKSDHCQLFDYVDNGKKFWPILTGLDLVQHFW